MEFAGASDLEQLIAVLCCDIRSHGSIAEAGAHQLYFCCLLSSSPRALVRVIFRGTFAHERSWFLLIPDTSDRRIGVRPH
jgi:hypothetical protein